jgi:TM2 domain-containing membrane protein YozV
MADENAIRSQMMYDANRKSVGVAYLLLIFLGGFGAHRFYLGRSGTAAAQLVLSILGIVLAIVAVGFILLAVVWIWLFVDLFLVPGIAREENMRLANALTGGVAAFR